MFGKKIVLLFKLNYSSSSKAEICHFIVTFRNKIRNDQKLANVKLKTFLYKKASVCRIDIHYFSK